VDAVGWEAACELLDESWEGWEADFLVEVVPAWIEARRACDARDERRWQQRLLRGGK
jgi:hypothetical protein